MSEQTGRPGRLPDLQAAGDAPTLSRGNDPTGQRLKAWRQIHGSSCGRDQRAAYRPPPSAAELAATRHRRRRATALANFRRFRQTA